MRKINAKIIVSLVVGLLVHQYPVGYGQFLDAFAAFERVNTLHDVHAKMTTPSTADLMDAAEEMVEKVDQLGSSIERMQNTLETLLNRLPLAQKITDGVEEINKKIARVDFVYDLFEDYVDDPESFNELELQQLIEATTSLEDGDVSDTLDQLQKLIVPKKLNKYRKSIFYNMAQQAKDNYLTVCDTSASPQQRLLELFNLIVDTETRGAVMMSFGITMQGYLKNVTTEGALRRARESLAARGEGYMVVLKESLKIAPTKFRRCDPPRGHRRDVTFYEYERFMQIFMAQITLLQRNHECGGKCEYRSQPTSIYPGGGCEGFECYGSETTCHGQVFDCESISEASICEYDKLQARRYAWYKIGSTAYGNPREGCAKGTIYSPSHLYQPSFEDNIKCDLCRCTCIEDYRSWSKRFTILREQLTNINDNMVATGFQLIMKNGFVQIKVMEGKLGPKGTIVRESGSWIEPEDIRYKSGDVVKKNNGKDEELEWAVDACGFDYDRRRINLDALSLPENYILTGVKFTRLKSSYGQPIQLEIHGTRFDYETGQLVPDDTIWITPEENDDRDPIDQDGLRNPLRIKDTNEVNPGRENFIELSMSDRRTDAGQTVFPFLDALPVVGEPPAPLVGLGLYYKGVSDYGGFLTLILEQLNRAHFLSDFEKIEE